MHLHWYSGDDDNGVGAGGNGDGSGGWEEDSGAGVYGGDGGDEEEDIHRRLVCLFSRLLAVPDLRHLEQTQ